MRIAPSSRRAAVASALTGLLALQFVLAGTGGPPRQGAAMAERGPRAAPYDGHAGAAEAAHLPAADPDADSTPMPCENEGACGWGLMHCDGADLCMPLQVLPADPPGFGEPTAAPTAALSSRRTPASVPATIDHPPPRT